ncbi:hypothetical protein JNM05_12300 [bacterium]|nr:hypothetical protein [bacterium]
MFNIFKKKPKPDLSFLHQAPGPSPWYIIGKELNSSVGILSWMDDDTDKDFAGLSFLKNRKGETLLILDFYCYLNQLDADTLLLWYSNRTDLSITFKLIKLSSLEPIQEIKSKALLLRSTKSILWDDNKTYSTYTISSSVEAGDHKVDFPLEFRVLDELLIVTNNGLSNNWDQMFTAIFVVHPKIGRLIVYPQDWFNSGKYDFGYQWITRAARQPETGIIFGDGIRIAKFELDESCRNVKQFV